MEKYNIAELIIGLEPKYEPLLSQVIPYKIKTNKKIDCNACLSDAVYASYHNRYPNADDALIEYMATGSRFYRTLLDHSGMLLHASAVEYEGKAYLFSAPSGTGKSTHTSLWMKKFSGATILNDDKPAIRAIDGTFYVYGTPWSGKTNLNQNKKIPLQGIAFIRRSETNEISVMPSMSAIENILNQTVRSGEQNQANRLLDFISDLVNAIPIYQLSCNMEPEAAQLSYQTMSKGVTK